MSTTAGWRPSVFSAMSLLGLGTTQPPVQERGNRGLRVRSGPGSAGLDVVQRALPRHGPAEERAIPVRGEVVAELHLRPADTHVVLHVPVFPARGDVAVR